MSRNLQEIEKIFLKLFETAEIAKFSPEQAKSYEESLKHYRDLKNSLDTAYDEGYEEGILEEKKNTIKLLHSLGYNISDIAAHTNSDSDFIKSVLDKLK